MKNKNLGWRLFIVSAVTVLGLIWALPNFVDTSKIWWPSQDKMVMGLDIQGGLHLVLRVDVQGALKQEATRMMATVRDELTNAKISFQDISVGGEVDRPQILVVAPEASDAAITKKVEDIYGPTFASSRAGSGLVFEMTELHVREFAKGTVERSIETIRNRIDEFGVAEPSIAAQGDDRILVQLPGIQDAVNAKELINKTARLDFMIVNQEFPQPQLQALIDEAEKTGGFKLGPDLKYTAYVEKLNLALKGKLPAGNIVRFEKPENAETMEAGRIPHLLMSTETVPGDLLTDAFVTPGETGRPVVSFRLDAVGGRQFGEMTTKHKGQMMAILLDGIVKSAPVIQSPITTQGQITLGSRSYEETMKEARTLSITLKSGALPAALEQLEERTVGPSVGADAIKKGTMGAMAAAGFVFLFMILYYRTAGLIASLSLGLNTMLTIAVLSALGASLTLPGLAGLALGLGMAVDASVLIYERIKEELRSGVSMGSAISLGYDKAFSSIFDANVTSIMVCVVLMYYGSGSIRGFAITLMTGLFITLFTAVFCTRAVYDLLVLRLKFNPSIKW